MTIKGKTLIVGFRECGHAEQAAASDAIHEAEISKWLKDGLTVRLIPLEDWTKFHVQGFLCDCKKDGTPRWNTDFLDLMLREMERDVREGLGKIPENDLAERQQFVREAEHEAGYRMNPEANDDISRIVGYWMYRLLECKPGAELPSKLVQA